MQHQSRHSPEVSRSHLTTQTPTLAGTCHNSKAIQTIELRKTRQTELSGHYVSKSAYNSSKSVNDNISSTNSEYFFDFCLKK